jgi:hypothetical protein
MIAYKEQIFDRNWLDIFSRFPVSLLPVLTNQLLLTPPLTPGINMPQKTLYSLAAAELETSRDESLWLKALVESHGDKEKAKYVYIKERVIELENNASDSIKNERKLEHDLPMQTLYEGVPIYFHGPIADQIHEEFRLLTNVDHYRKVRCDLMASEHKFLVVPAGKSRPFLELARTGSPVLGVFGLVGGVVMGTAALISDSRQKDERQEMKQKSDMFNQLVTLDFSGCTVKIKEVEKGSMWDIAGRSWETWFLFSGKGTYKEQEALLSIRFGIEGRSTTSTIMNKKINDVDRLCRLIGQPPPAIIKAKSVFDNGVF